MATILVPTLLLRAANLGRDDDGARLLVFDVKSTGDVPNDAVENSSGLIAVLRSEDPRLELGGLVGPGGGVTDIPTPRGPNDPAGYFAKVGPTLTTTAPVG